MAVVAVRAAHRAVVAAVRVVVAGSTVLVEAEASALELEAYWLAEGALTNMKIAFFGNEPFVYVILDRLGFTAGSARANDMQVEIGEVVFSGALAFLSNMARFLERVRSVDPLVDCTEMNSTPPSLKLSSRTD